MDSRTLPLLVLILSVIGLLLLDTPSVQVKDLAVYGKLYKVCGLLTPLKGLKKGCVYKLTDDTGSIRAVSFFGECVEGYACVYGRVEEYRGEKELVILYVS